MRRLRSLGEDERGGLAAALAVHVFRDVVRANQPSRREPFQQILLPVDVCTPESI